MATGDISDITDTILRQYHILRFSTTDMLKTLVGVPVIRTDKLIFLSVLSLVRRTENVLQTFHMHIKYKMDPDHLNKCKNELVVNS